MSTPAPAPDRADARLTLPALSVWGATAFAASRSPGTSLSLAEIGGLATALAGCALVVGPRTVGPVLIFACLACAASGFAVVGLRQASVGSGPLADLARASAGATLDVVVTGDPVLLVPHGGFRSTTRLS